MSKEFLDSFAAARMERLNIRELKNIIERAVILSGRSATHPEQPAYRIAGIRPPDSRPAVSV